MARVSQVFDDAPLPHRAKLAAMWASLMFCYIYCDYFQLFRKGYLANMNQGLILPLGEATPAVLLGVSVLMSLPSLMVAASVLLPVRLARGANIAIGTLFTLVQTATVLGGAPLFYTYFSAIEIPMTIAITIMAWRWPRAA
ncbi:MAG: DUF6326 family protein [Novosphingobium sp.]|jgi:hypothetical protein|uniref:DUF6326 family protein n=1 Tax=Novosphingobium sp. TaxID=1874826 RepID=UPI00391A2DD9